MMTTRPLAALDAQTPQHLGALLFGLRRVLELLFEADLAYGEPAFRSASTPVRAELVVAIGFSGDVDGWAAPVGWRCTSAASA